MSIVYRRIIKEFLEKEKSCTFFQGRLGGGLGGWPSSSCLSLAAAGAGAAQTSADCVGETRCGISPCAAALTSGMAGRVSVSFFSYDVPDGRDNNQEQEPGDRVGVVDPFDAVAAGVEPERPEDTEQAGAQEGRDDR